MIRLSRNTKVSAFLLATMLIFSTVLAETDNFRIETAANLQACLADEEAGLREFLLEDNGNRKAEIVKRIKSRIKFLDDELLMFSDIDQVDIDKFKNKRKEKLVALNKERSSIPLFEFIKKRKTLDHFSYCYAKQQEFAVKERKLSRENAVYVTKVQEQEIIDVFVDVLMDSGINKTQLKECAFSRTQGSIPPSPGYMIELKDSGVEFSSWLWVNVSLSYSLKNTHQKSDGVKPLSKIECNQLFVKLLEKSDKKIDWIIKS